VWKRWKKKVFASDVLAYLRNQFEADAANNNEKDY
jgi:hypothetical protein